MTYRHIQRNDLGLLPSHDGSSLVQELNDCKRLQKTTTNQDKQTKTKTKCKRCYIDKGCVAYMNGVTSRPLNLEMVK